MAYWILRSEPDAYGWDDLVRDGATEWNGVRNYTARNFIKTMAPGDQALFYHSNTQKAAVGIMAIDRAWQPDGDDGKWASVAVKPVEKLAPLGDAGARRGVGGAAGHGDTLTGTGGVDQAPPPARTPDQAGW